MDVTASLQFSQGIKTIHAFMVQVMLIYCGQIETGQFPEKVVQLYLSHGRFWNGKEKLPHITSQLSYHDIIASYQQGYRHTQPT